MSIAQFLCIEKENKDGRDFPKAVTRTVAIEASAELERDTAVALPSPIFVHLCLSGSISAMRDCFCKYVITFDKWLYSSKRQIIAQLCFPKGSHTRQL